MTRSSSRTLPGHSYASSASTRPPTADSGRNVPMAIEEVPRELQDVVAPRAQRRDLDVDAIQPVVEVEAEPAAARPARRAAGSWRR